MSFSNMSSSLLNNEASRSLFNKCIYCYEENHLYKKNYAKFNENLRIERIHLQKKRIHLDFYNLETFHVRMISYKNQRQCVKNVEKLAYSNRIVATTTEIHIVRLKENADLELFIDEKKKETVLMNHELYVTVVIFATIRSKSKVFQKSAKHHEFIKRILKRKIKKKRSCSFQKSCDRINKKKLR